MLPEQMPTMPGTKKSWPMWTKILMGVGIAVILAVFSMLIYLSVTDQPSSIRLTRGATEPEVEILTTTDEAKPGDIFGVDVKADDDKEVTSVKFYVDGVLEGTCEGETECSFTSGPFSDEDIGGHKYETEFTYSDGTSYKKSGTFSVSEKNEMEEGAEPEEVETSEPANAPDIKYFYTSNNYLSEGDLLVSSLAITDINEISYLDIQIDGESKKICNDSVVCSLSFVIPKNFYLGKHSITGRAIGTNGLVSYINTSFYIIEEVIPEEVYVSPTITIIPSKTQASVNEAVKFSAIVNPGSKTLKKTQININLNTVKECVENTCQYVGGPYTEFANLSVPYHAVSYFTDGTYINTGLQTIKIKPETIPSDGGAQDEPEQDEPVDEADIELPTISIKANKASMFNTEEAIILAQASDNEAVGEIIMFVDGQIVKTCKNVTTCSTIAGPYLDFTENKTILYGAYAIDSSGNDNWSGYSSIQVNIPDQVIEPTLKLILKKNNFNTDETLIMIADIDPGSKVLDYLSIWMGVGDGFTLKPCFDSCTVNSSLTGLEGQTIPIIARAFFTDGTKLTTETQTITVSASEVPADPTISLDLSKNSISEGEGFDVTATVDQAEKTITQIQITNNSNTVYKTCNNATTCYYDASSKPWIPGVHPFKSIATFSDGTVINSGLETIIVFATIEPTIELMKDKDVIVIGDQFNLSANVDSGSKTLDTLEIYDISGTLKETCTTLSCTYTVGPFDQTGLITFQAKATFTDNSTLESDLLFVTVYSNATPSVSISKDIELVVVGDIANLTASVKPAGKTISKLEILDIADEVLNTCYNSLTCTYSQNHSQGGVLLIRKAKATFTDNSTVFSANLSYFVGYPEQPTVELTKDKSPVVVGDVVGLTATVEPEGKAISKLEILDANDQALETCYNSLTCTYNQNHSQAGIFLIRKSKATFTDNSTMLSNVLTYYISAPVEPTIDISFSPQKKTIGVTASENCTISSTVDPGSKTVSFIKIYTEGELKRTCISQECSYSATAATMLGYTPSRSSGTLTYYATATFTDGSVKSVQGNPVTVTGD